MSLWSWLWDAPALEPEVRERCALPLLVDELTGESYTTTSTDYSRISVTTASVLRHPAAWARRKTSSAPLACPPRYGTPRNPRRPTYGPAVGRVAERLGFPLMPAQQHVADVALEARPDGSLYYREVVLIGPRQGTGKRP